MTSGEELLTKIFKKEHITFQREIEFNDCKSTKNGKYRFDFGIYENGKLVALCEWDGEQHFYQIPHFHKNRKDFLQRQGADARKDSYCLANHIPLYRIPFWEKDDIKTSKDIFTEKHRVKQKYHNSIIWREHCKK